MEKENCMIANVLQAHGATNRKNKLSARQLTIYTGLPKRAIQKIIALEREFNPILSCDDGYFLPDTSTVEGQRELVTCIATLTRRGGHTLVTARKLQKFVYSEFDGQQSLKGIRDGQG